jgi:16S rRNA processing protein RimM
MIRPSDVYKIGRIGKTHGVRGEVTMQFTDDIFDTADADYLVLDIDGILVPFFIDEYRFKNDSVAIMKFTDIDTPQQAQTLTDCNVFFPRSIAADTSEDISLSQIIGFKLMDAGTGNTVGTITAIDDSTINTLFEVKGEDGTELLIPASEELITDINPDTQTLTTVIPAGLL